MVGFETSFAGRAAIPFVVHSKMAVVETLPDGTVLLLRTCVGFNVPLEDGRAGECEAGQAPCGALKGLNDGEMVAFGLIVARDKG
jgi:hypothetical protein